MKELSSNLLNQVKDNEKVKFDDIGNWSIGDSSENKPYTITKAIPNTDFGVML